jgi:hypothetical protein
MLFIKTMTSIDGNQVKVVTKTNQPEKPGKNS